VFFKYTETQLEESDKGRAHELVNPEDSFPFKLEHSLAKAQTMLFCGVALHRPSPGPWSRSV